MKKIFAFLTIVLLPCTSYSDEAEEGRIGVGFQGLSYASGISAKYDFNEQISAQGILGFGGYWSSYSIRGIYRFTDNDYPLYAFGALSMFRYDGSQYRYNESASGIGYGGGVGVEYNWLDLIDADLPPLHWNVELGFMSVSSSINYGGLGGVFFGGGVTYYLGQ